MVKIRRDLRAVNIMQLKMKKKIKKSKKFKINACQIMDNFHGAAKKAIILNPILKNEGICKSET